MVTVEQLDKQINGFINPETNKHVPGVVDDTQEIKGDVQKIRVETRRIHIGLYILVAITAPDTLSRINWELVGHILGLIGQVAKGVIGF